MKTLPITTPKIIGFLHHAYPLAIVGNHEDYHPWFYNNFIQLFCNLDYFEKNNDHFIDFYFPNDPLYSYPCVEPYAIKPEYLSTNLDIVDQVVKAIDQNCYVYTHVDEYYIPNRNSHNKRNFTHNILVFGYEKNQFKVIGFDENQNFSQTKVSFAEFDVAYKHSIYPLTILYKYNPYNIPKLNITSISRSLKDYVYSLNSVQGNSYLPKNPIFGIGIYDYLSKYIDILKKNEILLDIRPLHILWEHKVCMSERIHYLQNNSHIKNDSILKRYKEIEQLAHTQRNNLIKYGLSKNVDTLNIIQSSINKLKLKEESLYTETIQELDSNF